MHNTYEHRHSSMATLSAIPVVTFRSLPCLRESFRGEELQDPMHAYNIIVFIHELYDMYACVITDSSISTCSSHAYIHASIHSRCRQF